ncbi:unnamed protein product [Caenorhabditis brenneri]
MVVERDNLLDERGLPKKPLRLSKLPFLMRKRAINFMSFGEKIRLAVVSEDMENYVKESRLDKSIRWTMRICDSSSSVGIDDVFEVAVMDNFPAGDMEGDKIPKREIAKWCDDKKEPIENLKIILKKLQDLLTGSVKPQEICLDLNVAEQKILEILTAPVYKDANELHFRNFRLEKKTIDAIMEICEFKKIAIFINLIFPHDYYHEKALKCEKILFNDAKWMRVTQLLTLRDLSYVYLCHTSLDSEDFDLFVKFWTTVDYDMCKEIWINTRDERQTLVLHNIGTLNVVGFDEVAAMFTRDVAEKFYLVISKSKNPAKKLQIAVIQIVNYAFYMKVRPVEDFKKLVDILNLVQLKNEKEIALENLEIEVQLDGWEEDEIEENTRGLRIEKQELEQRLMNLNVQFDGKQARLVREPAPAVVE